MRQVPPPQTVVETLKWIDILRYPDEPLDQYSEDFSDPRAAEALQAFCSAYEECLRERMRPSLSSGGADTSMLEGLGYGGSQAMDDESMLQRFTIAPPCDR
jgi:hypothetical protein